MYEGIYTDDGDRNGRIALKKLSSNLQLTNASDVVDLLACVQREITFLRSFRHPNIIRLLGYSLPTERALQSSEGIRTICLVYELADQGGLNRCIMDDEKAAQLSWQHRLRILCEISTALNYMHCRETNNPAYHRSFLYILSVIYDT